MTHNLNIKAKSEAPTNATLPVVCVLSDIKSAVILLSFCVSVRLQISRRESLHGGTVDLSSGHSLPFWWRYHYWSPNVRP